MNLQEYLEILNSGKEIVGGSDIHLFMHDYSQEALRLTSKLNNSYHSPEEIRIILSEIIGKEVDSTVGLFPPFNTDFGKNIHIGKNVFINSGCKFQDQGGVYIENGALIGHNAVITTINHNFDPEKRASMTLSPVHIGQKVWLGANVTIVPGVSIGHGSIIGAGSVVTRNIPDNVIAAGVPARIIRHI